MVTGSNTPQSDRNISETLTALPAIPSWNDNAEPSVDSVLTPSSQMWNRMIHSESTGPDSVFISGDWVFLPACQWALNTSSVCLSVEIFIYSSWKGVWWTSVQILFIMTGATGTWTELFENQTSPWSKNSWHSSLTTVVSGTDKAWV